MFKFIALPILALFSAAAFAAQPVETLPSGVSFQRITATKGESPSANSFVQVHYRGTTVDGKEFDSSYKRGQPTSFPLRGVIPCWTEGVQKMHVGEKAKLVCPPQTAYGPNGMPGVIAPNSTLNFEIELLAIQK